MLVMEYVELGSLSSFLRLHEDELIEETNRLLKYSLDIAQVILNSFLLITCVIINMYFIHDSNILYITILILNNCKICCLI